MTECTLEASSLEFLKRLLTTPGPSGFETAAAKVWRQEAGGFADHVEGDVSGNSIAVLEGSLERLVRLPSRDQVEQLKLIKMLNLLGSRTQRAEEGKEPCCMRNIDLTRTATSRSAASHHFHVPPNPIGIDGNSPRRAAARAAGARKVVAEVCTSSRSPR